MYFLTVHVEPGWIFYSESVYTSKCGIPTNSSAASWSNLVNKGRKYYVTLSKYEIPFFVGNMFEGAHNFLLSSSLAAPIPSDHRVFPLSVKQVYMAWLSQLSKRGEGVEPFKQNQNGCDSYNINSNKFYKL